MPSVCVSFSIVVPLGFIHAAGLGYFLAIYSSCNYALVWNAMKNVPSQSFK